MSAILQARHEMQSIRRLKLTDRSISSLIRQGCAAKSKIKEEIERFSIIRAVAAVERCDVAILLIDANEGVTDQDTKIAGIAHERGKAAIIAVNKWDSIDKDEKTMNKYLKDISMELKYMEYAPKVFISAMTGQRINRMLELIQTVYHNHAPAYQHRCF